MVEVSGGLASFRFFRPGANEVFLVGDFNNWRDGELRMTPCGDGWWQAQIVLPAGTHKFRYRADGQWFTDFAAFGIEYGPFGPDGIIRVIREPLEAAQAQRTAGRARDGQFAPGSWRGQSKHVAARAPRNHPAEV